MPDCRQKAINDNIILNDDRVVQLRYGLRSLLAIGYEHEGIDFLARATTGKLGQDELLQVVAAGLVHEGITAEELGHLIDPLELMVWFCDVFMAASNGRG